MPRKRNIKNAINNTPHGESPGFLEPALTTAGALAEMLEIGAAGSIFTDSEIRQLEKARALLLSIWEIFEDTPAPWLRNK